MSTTQVFYKATRMDGTDFRTGTVDYVAALASGEPVRHPAPDLRGGPEHYLSVATVATDCTGFTWPARLFEVEPVGASQPASSDLPNKVCCEAVRVLQELPAHNLFGPQGEQVVAFLALLPSLTTTQWAAAWDAAWAATRDATRAATRAAVWAATRDAARAATRAATRAAARDTTRYATRNAARAAARDATWDACLALLGRDLITEDQFNTLCAPMRAAGIDPDTLVAPVPAA